jgi:hypothetical protein
MRGPVGTSSSETQAGWELVNVRQSHDPRVELRKRVGKSRALAIVRKDGSVHLSANGALKFADYSEWLELEQKIAAALYIARHG